MADCKEIDAALGRLSGKIDGLSGRLNGLEARQKECCEKNKPQKPSDVDLEPLIRRISKLENDLKLIIDFIVQLRPILNILSKFRLFNFGGE
jgi:hypothetical protein